MLKAISLVIQLSSCFPDIALFRLSQEKSKENIDS